MLELSKQQIMIIYVYSIAFSYHLDEKYRYS